MLAYEGVTYNSLMYIHLLPHRFGVKVLIRCELEVELKIDTQVMLKRDNLKYLVSIIQENKEIKDDIAYQLEQN